MQLIVAAPPIQSVPAGSTLNVLFRGGWEGQAILLLLMSMNLQE